MLAMRASRRIPAERAATLDRRRMGVATVSAPPTPEVAGQIRYLVLCCTLCPCCGSALVAQPDPDIYEWYTCGVCGCMIELKPGARRNR